MRALVQSVGPRWGSVCGWNVRWQVGSNDGGWVGGPPLRRCVVLARAAGVSKLAGCSLWACQDAIVRSASNKVDTTMFLQRRNWRSVGRAARPDAQLVGRRQLLRASTQC